MRFNTNHARQNLILSSLVELQGYESLTTEFTNIIDFSMKRFALKLLRLEFDTLKENIHILFVAKKIKSLYLKNCYFYTFSSKNLLNLVLTCSKF